MKRSDIREHYSNQKKEVKDRLSEFKQLREAHDERMFKELVFVILSSRSSAKDAWDATEELDSKNLLLEGNSNQIEEILRRNGISYERDKASYIVENREMLSQPTLKDSSTDLKLKDRIKPENLEKTRELMVEEFKGVSWKGASHFLRNIGYGENFAIVSGHISKTLYKLGMVETPDQPTDRDDYLQSEQKLQELSDDLDIEIEALDLVLWSMETGEIFK